jgi:chemotaxis protein MotB
MQPHVAPIQLKPRQRREDMDVDDWLMTFADTITLLMAFFVIMFVLSDPNPKSQKFINLAEQLRLEGFTKVEVESEAKELKEQLQLMLEDSGFDQFASVKETPQFVEMELASTSFFEPTSARLTPDGLPLLEGLAKNLLRFNKSNTTIVVEGHTDDTPIATAQYPSNWELSAARASNVVRFFIARGISASQLSIAAYGDTRPKVINRDASGNPIYANQEINRRVVVKIIKPQE